MILRFKSNGDYLAFNTDLKIYTTEERLVAIYEVLEVSDKVFYKILSELNINRYTYDNIDFNW